MKLTKKQVEKAAQAAYDHDDMSKRWEDASFEDTEKEEWYGRIRAAFAAIEPEPVEVPQDLIRNMLDAWYGDTDGMPPYDDLQRESMLRVLRVALEDERVLGDPTVDENDEWLLEKFRGTTLQFVSHIIANRRARLLKPKTPEERVTIEHKYCPERWVVALEGSVHEALCSLRSAEIYRLGLIAKLKAEQESQS